MKGRRAYLRLGDDNLSDAELYATKREAVAAFASVARELGRWGQRLTASLHFAETRDELDEYPDFILSIGPRGGVNVEAA